MLKELRPKNVSGKNSTRDRPWYWLNYWHILISKDASGFTSNTLLIRIQYCYQLKYFPKRKKKEAGRSVIHANMDALKSKDQFTKI